MRGIEQEILQALRELESVATTVRSGGAPGGVRPVLERIGRLSASLPADAPGDLRHYLQRGSYEKARLFLEGRGDEAPPGTCGR